MIFKALDLFAGIGGIRLGFENTFKENIKFEKAIEIDDYCCQTYEKNFKENPKGDICDIEISSLPDFDILVAGFPCQAFSIAGRMEGFDDKRGNIFFYIEDIIRKKQPIAFLLENVKNLLHHKKGETFRIIKDTLEDKLGYNIYYKVLNASDFGLPQHRERLYIVGFKFEIDFKFKAIKSKKKSINYVLEKDVDVKYYLSEQYLQTLKNHRARHEAKGNGFGYQVIKRNQIANTIVGGGMGKERNLIRDKIIYEPWKEGLDPFKFKNAGGIRKMTEREWARLQGFPEDFNFPVSMTQAYKQLANSVPIPVIESIAKNMKQSLDKFYLKINRRNYELENEEQNYKMPSLSSLYRN